MRKTASRATLPVFYLTTTVRSTCVVEHHMDWLRARKSVYNDENSAKRTRRNTTRTEYLATTRQKSGMTNRKPNGGILVYANFPLPQSGFLFPKPGGGCNGINRKWYVIAKIFALLKSVHQKRGWLCLIVIFVSLALKKKQMEWEVENKGIDFLCCGQ